MYIPIGSVPAAHSTQLFVHLHTCNHIHVNEHKCVYTSDRSQPAHLTPDCMYMYIYAYTCICAQICMCTPITPVPVTHFTHNYKYIYIHISIYMYTCTNMYVHTHRTGPSSPFHTLLVSTYTYIHIHVYVHKYVCRYLSDRSQQPISDMT